MTDKLKDRADKFNALVDEATRAALDGLLRGGGPGLRSAIWAYLNTAWQRGKEEQGNG